MKKEAEKIKLQENELEAAETIKTEEIKKPYAFRRLSSDDLFLMFKIIGAIGINEFKACFTSLNVLTKIKSMNENEKKSENGKILAGVSIALEAGNVILNNIGKCKDDIYKMLENTSNLTIEEITAEGNAVMFMEMLIDFLKKEEFPDFFKVLSKLFK